MYVRQSQKAEANKTRQCELGTVDAATHSDIVTRQKRVFACNKSRHKAQVVRRVAAYDRYRLVSKRD
jgi:hypothetical protein